MKQYLIFLFGLFALVLSAFDVSAAAMGMVGITRGQMARVSVFHEGEAGFLCDSMIVAIDASGKVLATSTVTVESGKGAFG